MSFPSNWSRSLPINLLGIVVEEEEFEVADLARIVVNAVIEDDGIGTGFCSCYETQLVVSRARCIADDEGKTAHGDREAGDEDCRSDGARPCQEPDDPGVIGRERTHRELTVDEVGDVEDKEGPRDPIV